MCIILFVLLCVGYTLSINEGCYTRGRSGTCIPVTACPEAYNLLTIGQVDFCDYEGFQPLLCCPFQNNRPNCRPPPPPPPDLQDRWSSHPPPPPECRSHHRPPPRDGRPPNGPPPDGPPPDGPPPDGPPPVGPPRDRRPPNVPPYRVPTRNNGSPNQYDQGSDDAAISEEVERIIDRFSATSTSASTTTQNNKYVFPLPIPSDLPVSMKKCMEYYPLFTIRLLIKGGEKSFPKQFPHMALVGFGKEDNKEWLCGGSLISPNFILTAGHCMQSKEYGEAKWIRLGDLDISTDTDDAKPQDFKIVKIIPHPEYKPPIKYNDIALMELDKNITPTAYVSPACLQTTKLVNETKMSATGWGKVDFASDASNFLMSVDLSEIDSEKCRDSYKDVDKSYLPNGIMDDRMICAGGEIGKDSCEGDSGGPLQVKNTFRSGLREVSNIVGITSFGKACGLSKSPGVYTRVSYYIDWIESIVWPDEYVMHRAKVNENVDKMSESRRKAESQNNLSSRLGKVEQNGAQENDVIIVVYEK